MAIFVNYRRDDSESITGRIDDRLRAAFGENDVYRDIDSIPFAVDFVDHLTGALRDCDICIAVIGRHWLNDRLLDEGDFVRLELEWALTRGVPLIPVLVERADLPRASQLPESLRRLVRRQAIRIDSGTDFKVHASRLIDAIKQVRKSTADAEHARQEAARVAEQEQRLAKQREAFERAELARQAEQARLERLRAQAEAVKQSAHESQTRSEAALRAEQARVATVLAQQAEAQITQPSNLAAGWLGARRFLGYPYVLVPGSVVALGVIGVVAWPGERPDHAESAATATATASPGSTPAQAIRASYIVVKFKGALGNPLGISRSKDEARTRAEGIVAMAKAGEPFASLADRYSDDPDAKVDQGNMGRFDRNDVGNQFGAPAFDLKPGEVSGVVETDYGFLVIKRAE